MKYVRWVIRCIIAVIALISISFVVAACLLIGPFCGAIGNWAFLNKSFRKTYKEIWNELWEDLRNLYMEPWDWFKLNY